MGLVTRFFRLWTLVALAGVVAGCNNPVTLSPTSTPTTPLPDETVTTSTVTTSTTVVATTTSTSEPAPRCRPDPFTEQFNEEISTDYRNMMITAHVHDLRTGCWYSLNPENRQATASVFKVMVMAGTLLESQNQTRAISADEMDLMIPMITESANSPVRSLWRSFGSSPWFQDQGVTFGLRETRVVGDDGSAWGTTQTSALDQVNLLRQVLLGDWGPLNSEYRAIALDLMKSVVPSQTWGITAGVPDDWTVAQKNGFAGLTINSVGWVDEPGTSEGYIVAVLTRGWPSHPDGIAAVERISEVIAASMIGEVN